MHKILYPAPCALYPPGMWFLFLLLLLPLPLHAAEPPAFALVVDVKRVLDESQAALAAQKKIEEQRSAFQDEISVQEKRIRDAEQELGGLRGKLDVKQYAERENQLRQQFRDVEKYVQDRRQALERATNTSMGKVKDVTISIVQDIARKRGAQMVLVKQQVLWSENQMEITDEVLRRLNQQLPEVAVDLGPAAPKK
jgi:outer membrane protein